MCLSDKIYEKFKSRKRFKLSEVYKAIPYKPKTTLRARIYDNIGTKFEKVAKGIYRTIDCDCLLIEGNGRKLDMIGDSSIDCIITDSPWEDKKSNLGGNRNFTQGYNCYTYTIEDFKEKARVLKDGGFLVEFIPAENENNYKYLYKLKIMAEESGFKYYSKVTWKKGKFVSNTGRKSKNTEEIMIFSKGKARNLRLDAKRSKALNKNVYMSGTTKMLPTMFDIEPVPRNERIVTSEKPLKLLEEIIEYVTLEGEIILDQHAGSGVTGVAAINKKRRCVLIEILHENIIKIKNRLNMNLVKEYI